jgi:chromosome segregation ATPase
MAESRDPLTLDSVITRFTASEKLLAEAGQRIVALAEAQASAEASAGALNSTGQAVRKAANSIEEMARTLTSAHKVVVDSLSLSADFLRQSDLSQVLKTMKALSERVRALEKAQEGMSQQLLNDAEDVQAALAKVLAAVDRTGPLEQERDEYKLQLDRLTSQIPDRTRRKLGL